jgi:hypothetical protein
MIAASQYDRRTKHNKESGLSFTLCMHCKACESGFLFALTRISTFKEGLRLSGARTKGNEEYEFMSDDCTVKRLLCVRLWGCTAEANSETGPSLDTVEPHPTEQQGSSL